MRDCRLVGLLDLALEKDYVRGKVGDYMNKLIDMGVAGFRVDACKHMWPGDLSAVYGQLHNLNTKWFSAGSRPFIYQEVLLSKHTHVQIKYQSLHNHYCTLNLSCSKQYYAAYMHMLFFKVLSSLLYLTASKGSISIFFLTCSHCLKFPQPPKHSLKSGSCLQIKFFDMIYMSTNHLQEQDL